MEQIVLQAFAKINLGLRIVRKRADGYHDIETVFHRIHPFDEITIAPSDVVSMTSSRPDLPTDETNLCVRAAILLGGGAGLPGAGVSIGLRKNIPIGGGLGGGSSDAAALLLGLNRLWRLGRTVGDLRPLALRLGSDVPYFLEPGSAHASGRGEILDYFPLPLPYWVVVVFPGIHIATAAAYREVSLRAEEGDSLREIVGGHVGDPDYLRAHLRNDFEPWAIPRHPEIGLIKEELYRRGASFAQMSGSGSSVYGLFAGESAARTALERFGAERTSFLTPPGFDP